LKVLLDTPAYSALHRGDPSILTIMQDAEIIGLPAVVLGELYSGFRQGTMWAKNHALLSRLLSKPSVRVLTVTEATAMHYAEIDVYLRKHGKPIPRNDVWIAASAIEHGMQVVTLDSHFREVPLLVVRP
jgi:predicted nucleic acid-binding protein